MATEPMAVRKYVRKNRSTIYNLSSKGALEYVIKAGYVSVSNSIRDSDGYSRFQVDNIKKVNDWCDNTFNNKHWIYMFHHWFFTKHDDSTMFKLTWL